MKKKIIKQILKGLNFIHEHGFDIIVYTFLIGFSLAVLYIIYKIGQLTGLWYVSAILLVFVFVCVMSTNIGLEIVSWLEHKLEEA